jgi:hypothetical protein
MDLGLKGIRTHMAIDRREIKQNTQQKTRNMDEQHTHEK